MMNDLLNLLIMRTCVSLRTIQTQSVTLYELNFASTADI